MSKNPKAVKNKTELAVKLGNLKEQWCESRAGHRQNQYRQMQEAMNVAIEFRGTPDALAELRTIQKIVPASKTKTSKDWVTVAVVAIMTAAKTKAAFKDARRRARALDYLYFHEKVKLDNIAAAIKKRGGIQKIASAAAKQEPRRKVARGSLSKVKVLLSKSARNVSRRMKDGEKIELRGIRTVDGDVVLIKIQMAHGVIGNENDDDDWD